MADDEWLELSHPIDRETVRMPFLPRPDSRTIPDAALRATEVTLATHVGTHVEAPKHRFPDGAAIDEYSPERWITRGHVSAVPADRGTAIAPGDLTVPEAFEAGDALLLRTGWEERVGEEAYFEPPYFSEETAARIADLSPCWVGVDAPTPEIPDAVGATDSAYPVHSALFDADVLIAENLTNLEPLVGRTVTVVAVPLPLVGAEAANVRMVARPR